VQIRKGCREQSTLLVVHIVAATIAFAYYSTVSWKGRFLAVQHGVLMFWQHFSVASHQTGLFQIKVLTGLGP
jgi:hypothetical protein